eukprot:2496569-Heterocapsa_arctica.AAC.1
MKDIMKLAEETLGRTLGSRSRRSYPKDEVIRVVNSLTYGKAKGVDGWSPAELRAPSRSHIKGLTDLLNKYRKVSEMAAWPSPHNCTHCQGRS